MSSSDLSPVHLALLDDRQSGVELVLAWRGDRWGQLVRLWREGTPALAFESLEGAADDWPVSPPFQELSDETLADGRRVLFLVGRAGTSHWSASIEARGGQLVFDIACRHSRSPERLGSTYVQLAETPLQLQPAGAATTLTLIGNERMLAPATIATTLPATTRWQYTIG